MCIDRNRHNHQSVLWHAERNVSTEYNGEDNNELRNQVEGRVVGKPNKERVLPERSIEQNNRDIS